MSKPYRRLAYAGVLALCAQAALAQDESTVRVLDEVTDAQAVLESIEPPTTTRLQQSEGTVEALSAARRSAAPRVGELSFLALELDRDEEFEGEVEDFDVPEDLGTEGAQ